MEERPVQVRDGSKIARDSTVDAAVERIADDRVTYGAQVHSNLMRAAGVDGDFGQGQAASEMLRADDPRHRLTAAARAPFQDVGRGDPGVMTRG